MPVPSTLPVVMAPGWATGLPQCGQKRALPGSSPLHRAHCMAARVSRRSGGAPASVRREARSARRDAQTSVSWSGSGPPSGTTSSSGPSTPALLTAGLAGAAAQRASLERGQQVERGRHVDVGRSATPPRPPGPSSTHRHAVVDGRADVVGLGGQDRRRGDPLVADLRLAPQAGERERRAAVDRVAERDAGAPFGFSGFSHSYQPSASTRQRRSAAQPAWNGALVATVSERTLIGVGPC